MVASNCPLSQMPTGRLQAQGHSLHDLRTDALGCRISGIRGDNLPDQKGLAPMLSLRHIQLADAKLAFLGSRTNQDANLLERA